MLKSITTTNFKKLDNHHFEFTSGLNILCGDNMAGKTTLTQAVMFCLFGVRALPCAADGIPTWGETDCSVALEVGDYVITRSIKNCKVYEGKKLVATGNSPCSRYIEEHITGIDLKGFKILNWSEAGETSALLTIGATQLQRDVEKFSGVAFIDEIIKLAGVDLRDAERDVGLFESKGGIKELEKLIGPLTSEVGNLTDSLKTLQDSIPWLNGKLDTTHEKLKTSNDNNRKAVKAERAIVATEISLKGYDEQITQYTADLTEAVTELEKLTCLTDSEISAEKKAIKEAVTINGEISEADESARSANELLASCPAGIEFDNRLTGEVEMAGEVASVAVTKELIDKTNLDTAKAESSRLNSALTAGVCYACGQRIDEEEEIIKYQNELMEINVAVDRLTEIHTDSLKAAEITSNELAEAKQNKIEGFGHWEVNEKKWLKEIQSCKDFLSEVELTEPAELERREAALEQSIIDSSKYEDAERAVAKYTRKLDSVETHKYAASVDLEELKNTQIETVSQDAIARLETDIQNLNEDIKTSITNAGEVKLSLSEANVSLSAAKENLKQELNFQDINKEVKLLKELIAYLKTSRTAFLSSVWAQILGAASGFLAQATDNVITALSKSDKDGFMFCENGIYAPVSAASGSQRGFLGVGIRLALAQSLRSSCPIVVLDEPTEAMREENALRLSGALLGHGQILMVTHRESDKVAAANVIEL